MGIDATVFTISRRGSQYFEALEEGQEPDEINVGHSRETAENSLSSSIKWVCPDCGLIMRSYKKDVFVICGHCKKALVPG